MFLTLVGISCKMNPIPPKQFDQLSCSSFRSQISRLNFTSPLPLPQNPNKIPSNDQIGETYEQMQQHFSEVQLDKLVSVLYNNVITPKIQEGNQSEKSSKYSQQSKEQCRSRYSHQSSATMIRRNMLSFKVHPNSNITTNNQNHYNQISVNAKRRRKPKVQIQKQEKEMADMNKLKKGENEQNLRKAQCWKSQENKQHQLFSKTSSLKFASKQEQVVDAEKKLGAKVFCQQGYGIQKLKNYVWQTERTVLQIQKRKYKLISTAFVSESYRRLEQFLIEDCGRNIRPLTAPEVKALVPILLSSQLKFQDDEYLTFRKFVSVTYDLGSVPIFEQMAVKLYIKIQLCLRGRIGAMRLDRQYKQDSKTKRQMLRSPGRFLNQRLENESIWTSELQFELIDTIEKQKTIAKTRDALKLKYGENAILNNVKELKARFFKILRIAAKRLIRYASQYAQMVPLLVQLDDDKIKVLIRHPAGRESRYALGRLYKANAFDRSLLRDVIHNVNQFCYLEQTRRETNDKPKQPEISSITDKIKHNIKVSRKMLKNVTTPAQRVGPNSDLVYLKNSKDNYQHIVSLQHNDKLHYFRHRGVMNNKGGFEYGGKDPELKRLEMEDGDDDSEQLVMLSDDDYDSENDHQKEEES